MVVLWILYGVYIIWVSCFCSNGFYWSGLWSWGFYGDYTGEKILV
jgi:hypothetical protein